jgi:hypothetical protein
LTVDFGCVVDPKLRGYIEQFHAEATQAYEQKRYVSAVVLCGGALEGLLTFALGTRLDDANKAYAQKGRRRIDLSRWDMADLVDVAAELQLIGEGPAKSANAIRDFRNLIHPARLLRRSTPRWDALAVMSLAALAEVCRSLSGRIQA